jgi:hypothetical protein
VAIDDRYALGINLAEVDDLLGLERTPVDPLLPGEELVERTVRLLEATIRFAQQLPPAHYDDAIPGMEGVKGPLVLPNGTAVVLPDGTPYVPHRTSLGLVRHIIGHGVKFKLLAEDPESDLYRHPEIYLPLGEPDHTLGLPDLLRETEEIIRDIQRWWGQASERDLERVVHTLWGAHSLQKVLHQNTYSLAQRRFCGSAHARPGVVVRLARGHPFVCGR